jgi:hypothetical protein
MMLTRILMVSFISALSSGTLAAEPYPTQCRTWSCSAVPALTATPLTRDSVPASVRVGTQNISVAEQTIISPSSDGQVHACIGYDAFGDRKIMCLLVP